MSDQKQTSDLKFLFRQILENESEQFLSSAHDKQPYFEELGMWASKIASQVSPGEPSQVLSRDFYLTLHCFAQPKTPRPLSKYNLTPAEESNLKIIYAYEVLDHLKSKCPNSTFNITTPEQSFKKHTRWWDGLTEKNRQKIFQEFSTKPRIKYLIESNYRGLLDKHSNETRKAILCYHYYFDYLHGASRNQEVSLEYLITNSTYNDDFASIGLRARLNHQYSQNNWLQFENDLLWLNLGLNHHNYNHNHASNYDEDAGKALLLIIAVIAALYALKEIIKSCLNILRNKKHLRSIYRLCMIAAGVALAIVFVPHMIVVTSSFSLTMLAMIGAGVGAVIGKYSSKFISSLANSDEINPSSPNKYQLSSSQKLHLKDIGVNLTELNKLLKSIRDVKSKKFAFYSSWPWTESYDEKKRFNKVIKDLKDGKLLGIIYFNNVKYDLFARPVSSPVGAENSGTPSRVVRFTPYLVPDAAQVPLTAAAQSFHGASYRP